MNVLFAVSDTGFGHRAAAQAIDAALTDRLGASLRSDIVDVYSEMDVPMLRSSPEIYARSSRHGRPAFDLFFGLSNRPGTRRATIGALDKLAGRQMLSLVEELEPDLVVVCNPFYMGELFTLARLRSSRPFSVVTVVTDPVTVHQSWLAQDADMHFVIRPGAAGAAAGVGYPCQEISFPIHPRFVAKGPSRKEARASLGLRSDAAVVLLSGGGSGGGRMHEWTRLLKTLAVHPEIEVMVAAGTNRAIVDYLSHPEFGQVRLLPSTESLNVPMRAASAVMSKAGPATIFEAAAVGVPLLLFDEVGRQERGNIAYAQRLGVGQALGSRNVTRLVTGLETRSRSPQPELAMGAAEVADWIAARASGQQAKSA